MMDDDFLFPTIATIPSDGSAPTEREFESKPPPPSNTSTSNATAPNNRRGTRLRDKIQTKLKSEEVQKRRQQAGNAFKNLGSQLQKINLGKLIDQMESDQHLSYSLESLNERMKEEGERHEIRREAEARTLEVIKDHLEVFLQEHENATYEEWIEDLHPENANQGKLLSDIQEIDQRFYVYESDHRQMWNEEMRKLEDNDHRIVEARTQIWGKAGKGGAQQDGGNIDLISGSVEFQSTQNTKDNNKTTSKKIDEAETETVDFFSGAAASNLQDAVFSDNNKQEEEPSEDLIKF